MKEGFNFDAIYHYGIRSQETGLLHYFDVACEIIGETDKSYRIRLKGAVERHEQGEVITVRKRSISYRSYYDKERRWCTIYDLEPKEVSCRACRQNCLRKKIFLVRGI